MKIKYRDLGRSKAKGEIETCPEYQAEDMYKEFSKHLLSSDISFENGKVYAGFHRVGYYEVMK